jgi:hypothetical protein
MIGTTSPIKVPADIDSTLIRPGVDYFFVQVHSAQAFFSGPIWESGHRLLVTSRIKIAGKSDTSGEIECLHRTREIRRNCAVQLGLSPDLISLVPADMESVAISVDFIVDTKNRLAQLTDLVNSDAFVSAFSAAPGAALVARTVGNISKTIVHTFLEGEDRVPILEFSGTFSVSSSFYSGYYVIMGSRDCQNPLPFSWQDLDIKSGKLILDKSEVTSLSYVILKIVRCPARTRALGAGKAWESKLSSAEALAFEVGEDFSLEDTDRKRTWIECKKLLQEARVLLLEDRLYHHWEVRAILETAFKSCSERLIGEATRSPLDRENRSANREIDESREVLGLSDEAEASEVVSQYEAAQAEAAELLKDVGPNDLYRARHAANRGENLNAAEH